MRPTETIDMGDRVLCDWCGREYTDSDAIGGFVFESKATGPECCAKRLKVSIKVYGEQHLVRATALDGETFAAFVRRIRGDQSNEIRVYALDNIDQLVDLMGETNSDEHR